MAKKPGAKKAAAKPKASKLVFVVEGDSWEHLPDLGLKVLPTIGGANFDLSRALAARGHVVHNLAYWGDTIADIARLKHYLPALRHSKAPFLLLGGGGNDLLGGGRLRTYLNLYRSDRPVSDYINGQFDIDLGKVMLDYRTVLTDIAGDEGIAGTRVVVHGYDYARPMKLGWLGKPLEFMGIDEFMPDLQNAIVKVLIDAFNRELQALAARWGNVTYVDFRGRVGSRWHDELHPTAEAFQDLAAFLESRIV